MIRTTTIALTVPLALAAATSQGTLLLGDPEAGKAVHERHCISCHASRFGNDGTEIYTHPNRAVGSIEGLMAQVERCNEMTGAGLSEDQVNDLIAYLNETFYQFE